MFWNLLYPLILVTFFYTAFLGITDLKYEDINIGIETNNPISQVLESIEIINVQEIPKYDAPVKLNNGSIDGFIDKDLNIAINSSGINQTVIKEIVDQIKQMDYLDVPMERFDFTVDYIADEEQSAKGILVIFYSLIAMVSAYSVFAGIETVSLAQGNLTNIGARLNMTPLKRRTFLFAGIIVALILNLVSNIILLLFMEFILKLGLFTEIKYSSILIILGNLFGVSLGVFIGASNRQSVGVKTMISIVATLFLSFLSGLMSPDMKILIDKKIPILGKINPVSLISDNLYRVNLLENTQDIGVGMLILASYSAILIFGSYMFLRRRNYDSI